MSGISLPEAELADRAEALAAKLRDLIASQPPKDLLGYIYAGVLLNSARSPDSLEKPSALAKIGWEEAQFLLEYVHAVLAGSTPASAGTFDESLCAKIFSVSEELRACSMMLAMAIAINSSESAFGAATKDLLFSALSSWILIRGNRYQTLEEEFYKFTLGVHDAALRKVYGVGANEIAQGIQELSDSVRHGHGHAMGALEDAMHDAHEFTSSRDDVEGIAEEWRNARPDKLQAALGAYADLFQGGICCVSRHTSLPEELLRDLSYDVGEDDEFFAPGRYCGTPFRTLPARKKPLIKIDGEYYLTDPSFARDAAYRAILWNLLRRDPGYKEEFKIRQKEMSEAAFPAVFANQLQDAKVYNEVWYRKNGNWYENDTLILIDDVLVLVEAKAGAAATIASPAADFSRHVQSLKDLIIKAYEQCRRFLEYLASEKEVALYKRENDKYVEMLRIRLDDFRLVLPIGLTVESFSPFSTSSKQIPGIAPILGLHPFISVSIDETLVLGKFLRSSGELFHYLQVRQLAAGVKNAFIFDETDHLGAYLSKNLFPSDLERQLSEEGANMIVLDKTGEIVDEYFALVDPDAELPPAQEFPSELKSVLATIDQSRGNGFLKTDSFLRDLGEEGRQQVSGILQPIRESLRLYPSRYVLLMTPQGPIFFWLHRDNVGFDSLAFQKKSEAAVAASGAVRGLGLVLTVNSAGAYTSASHHEISSPDSEGAANADVAAMKSRIFEIPEGGVLPPIDFGRAKRLGRNEPCWCGSGKKFKRCHGS